ncbi:MAG: LacI family transcriptional regulator [Micrococcales bacterium]|nr:LacI family transcriptional regulator [Micrococcales bacterium]
MAPRASIKDVALEAGVSVATVSYAINTPERVSSASLERVRAAIARLGYVRNEAARQLRVGSSNMLGLVMLDLANPFFTDIALGSEAQASANGLSVLLGNSHRDCGRENSYLDLFAEGSARGIVITPSGVGARDKLLALRSRGIPVVLVDAVAEDEQFGSISLDNRLGGERATQHLIDQGNRNITFVGTRKIPQITDRLRGAEAAVAASPGVALNVLTTNDITFDTSVEVGLSIARRPRRDWPDAIFAANDIIAVALLQAFNQSNITVPDDIALIGFDDITYARTAAVPLSTVRQPARLMGSEAVTMLLEIEQGADPRHIRIEPELVIRASTYPTQRKARL